MVNSKKKGNLWENRWANWLTYHGIKAWKDGLSGGGNKEKSDVGNNIDINFEVKAGKQVPKKVYDFYDQSEKDAVKTHNIPYVVMHRDGRPSDEFMVMMNSYDWLTLWKKAQEPKQVKHDKSREGKYLISSTIVILKKLLKYLEN